MAVGTINEDIILKSLPNDSTFTVIEFIPEERDKWYSWIDRGKKIPYNVSEGELIAITNLSTTNVLAMGSGVSVSLRFKLIYSNSGSFNEKMGYIKVSSTNWPLFGRPEYSLLIFGFDGDIPTDIRKKIPFLMRPDPWYLGIGIQDNKIALVASADASLSTTVISNILNGIIKAHETALRWIIKPL